MGLQRGTEISAPLPRLVPLQEEDKNLSLPRPFAICNYPNPALHLPYNLPDLWVKNGTVGIYCNSGFKKQTRYAHSIPPLLWHFPAENEESRDKERQGWVQTNITDTTDPLQHLYLLLLVFATTNTWICNTSICSLGLGSVVFAL